MMSQSYEKLRAKQKKSFFFLPRWRNFAILLARLRKKNDKLLIYVKESAKSGKNCIVCAHNVKKPLTFAPDFKITVWLKGPPKYN